MDRDDPTGDGDYETISDYASENSCENPTAIDARARSSGSTAVTHIDLAYGFWCNNDEQSVESGGCADFEVRFCCPKKAEKECNAPGHKWTVWLDRDDPNEGTGDWENRDGFPANVVCQTPTAVQAQVKSGSPVQQMLLISTMNRDSGVSMMNSLKIASVPILRSAFLFF